MKNMKNIFKKIKKHNLVSVFAITALFVANTASSACVVLLMDEPKMPKSIIQKQIQQ